MILTPLGDIGSCQNAAGMVETKLLCKLERNQEMRVPGYPPRNYCMIDALLADLERRQYQ